MNPFIWIIDKLGMTVLYLVGATRLARSTNAEGLRFMIGLYAHLFALGAIADLLAILNSNQAFGQNSAIILGTPPFWFFVIAAGFCWLVKGSVAIMKP